MYPRISCFSDEISPDFSQQLDWVSRLGLHAIEIRGVNGRGIQKLTLEEAEQIKKQLDEKGIHVSSIGSPIGKIAITEDFTQHYDLLQHVIKIAHILDTSFIRMFSFFIPQDSDPENYRDEVMRRMENMVRLADKEKVTLLHENEKGIYGDVAPRCADLMEQLYCPHFKAVFDFANFVQVGQETVEAYELMRRYVVYVHIKDALQSNGYVTPAGWGDGNVKLLLGKLKESGYDGYFSLEPHLTAFTGLNALQNEDNGQKANPMDGPSAFRMALDALQALLYQLDWQK